MIVKDEEKNIINCLNRAMDLVDEAIIVDTGSTDKTKKLIIENYGMDNRVKLIDYIWENDFSKARNESIKHATGDWILVLDADERIFADKENLRKLINSTDKSAFVIPIYNVIDRDNIYITPSMVRLYKNINPRYEGAIHEQILLDSKILLPDIIDAEICKIYHYGYTDSIFEEKDKQSRNMEIIKSEIEKEPDNPFNWYNKGVMEMREGNFGNAIDDFLKSHSLTKGMRTTYHNDLVVRVAQCMIMDEQYNQAIDFIKAVIKDPLIREIPDIYYYGGIAYVRLEKYSSAINYFKKAIDVGEYTNGMSNFGAGSFLPKIEWAKVLFLKKKKREAIEKLKEAVFDENNVKYQGLDMLKELLKQENLVEELEELKNDISRSSSTIIHNNEELEIYKTEIKENIQKLVESGMLEESKKLIEEYEKIVKDDIDIFSIKGVIAMIEGNIEEAEKILLEGLQRNNKNFDILYNLGYLYQFKNNDELSAKYYIESLKYSIDDKVADDIHKILRELNISEDLKKQIINKPARSSDELIYNGKEKVFLNEKGKYKELKEHIEFYIEQGFISDAKQLLKEYEKLASLDIDIYSFKGIIAMLEGDLDEAEYVLLEGMNLDANNVDLLCNLGYLYSIKRDYDLSLDFYKKALVQANSKEIQEEIVENIRRVQSDYENMILQINHYREVEFKNRLDRVIYSKEQKLALGKAKERIHVVYVLNHVGICGGVKVILEHANRLVDLGVEVTLVCHYPKPNWYQLKANYIMVESGKDLAEGIPDCDVIVATYWDHIQACIETNKAPVVYFEQGDFHLFDVESIPKNLFSFIKRQFELPKFIITVSNRAANAIKKVYSRQSDVIHNAIEKNIFNTNGESYISKKPYILMMGSDQMRFKGLDDIFSAYKILKDKEIDLDLVWVTPTTPLKEYNEVSRTFVNPSQKTIAELYRGAFVFVSASHYESFSLPILEAMACGCPVITTDNEGASELVENYKNGLFVEVQNPLDIASKIEKLIEFPDLRDSLINNGLITSDMYSWDNSLKKLLDYFKYVAQYKPIKEESIEKHEKSEYFSSKSQTKRKKISLIYTNLSGSNTIALYKMADQYIKDKYDISLVFADMSNKYLESIVNSDIAIFTEGNYPFQSKANGELPIVIDLWHGFPLKAMGYADKGEKFKDLIKKQWNNVDYITSYSPLFNNLMNNCISTDPSKYIITGAQRNDLLLWANGRKNIEYLFDENFNDKKFIFYMPTYRYTPRGERTEGNRSWENIFGFESFNPEEFHKFLEVNNIILIVKLHPAEEHKFVNNISENKNIKIVTNNMLFNKGLDLYEILNAANILITDYSGVYFDTLLFDLPIIFTPVDLKEYKKDRGLLLEPYDEWTPGPKCITQKDLQNYIIKYLSDPKYYHRERNDVLNKVHEYFDGNSSERTWRFIEKILEKYKI